MTNSPLALTLYRRSATEADMLTVFTDLAAAGGGFLRHVRDARGQNLDGLPDVILAVPPVLAMLELKTRGDTMRPEQMRVLDILSRCNVLVSGKVRPVPRYTDEMSIDEALARIVAWRPDLEIG